MIREESDSNGEHLSSSRLNRIDLTFYPQESRLFQAFAANDLDWIPEVGPQTQRMVLGEGNSLSPGYTDQYNLHNNGERRIHLYLNETRRANMAWLQSRLSDVNPDSIEHAGELTIETAIEAPDSVSGEPDSQYYVTFTSDPHTRMLSNKNIWHLNPNLP